MGKPKDTIADRPGVGGDVLLDRLLREATALILQGDPPALVRAVPLVSMLLLLHYAWADCVTVLSQVRWGDIAWDESAIVIPGGCILSGQRVERSIMLEPVTATLLWIMWRHGPGDREAPLLADPAEGEVATTEAIGRRLRGMIKEHGLTPTEMRVLACCAQREVLPSYLVSAYIAGEGEVRPLRDAAVSTIGGYVARRFIATEATVGEPGERERGLPRGPFIAAPPAFETYILEARTVIVAGGASAAVRRELVAIAVRVASHVDGMFAALVGDYARADPTFQLDRGPEVKQVRRAWRAQAARNLHGEEAWAFNLFCTLLYVAYRANRPSGEKWFEADEATPGRRPRPHTLEAFLDDLIAILRRIGETPLNQWRAHQWRALDALPREHDTRVRLRVTVQQFARFVRTRLDLVVVSGWSISLPERRARTFRMPHIEQLAFVAELLGTGPLPPGIPSNVERLLARDGMREALALLYAVILRYGLRSGEALALLMRDVDLLGDCCWVARSKTHRSRSVPGGYAPYPCHEQLERRRADLAHVTMSDDDRAPTLIPGARDAKRRASLRYALGVVLGMIGLTPHDLRHVYATLRIAGAWAWRADPEGAWPTWVVVAGQEPDSMRGTAQALGQTTSRQLRETYDHSGLWLIARAWERRAASYVSAPTSWDRIRLLFRCGDTTLRDVRAEAVRTQRFQAGGPALAHLLPLARVLREREGDVAR